MSGRAPRLRVQMRDDVYQRLRDDIISNRILPGARLIEEDLARRYDTSRTPVREALNRLRQDGLVADLPRRGVVVTALTENVVRDVYEMRAAIESFAVVVVVAQGKPEHRAQLQAIHERMGRLAASGDVVGYLREDGRFHRLFLEAWGNRKAIQAIDSLSAQVQRILFMAMNMSGRVERSYAEHARVVQAFVAGDAEATAAAMRSHLLMSLQNVLLYLGFTGPAAASEGGHYAG